MTKPKSPKKSSAPVLEGLRAAKPDEVQRTIRALAAWGPHGMTEGGIGDPDPIVFEVMEGVGLAQRAILAQIVEKGPGQEPYLFRRRMMRLTREGLSVAHDMQVPIGWTAKDRAFIQHALRSLVRLSAALNGHMRPELWADPTKPGAFSLVLATVRGGLSTYSAGGLYDSALQRAILCASRAEYDIEGAYEDLDLLRLLVQDFCQKHPVLFEGATGGYVCREELGWPYAHLKSAPLFQQGARPRFSEDPELVAKAT